MTKYAECQFLFPNSLLPTCLEKCYSKCVLKLSRFRRRRHSAPSPKHRGMSFRRAFSIIAALVLLAAGPGAYLVLHHPTTAAAAWFDNRWAFRQAMPITNTSGSTQTGWQMQLTIDTATLIANNKLQSSCQDVRFTSNVGVTLPFWIEPNTCNTSTTLVWVKVDSIPTAASGTAANIYFYYGNPTIAAATYTTSQVFVRDLTGDTAVWPLQDTTTTQSYAAVNNPSVATGRNTILNGTFESWSNSTTATSWTNSLIGSGTINQDPTSHSGAYAARLDVTSGAADRSIITQPGFLTTGKAYNISFWAKSSVGGVPIGVLNAGGGIGIAPSNQIPTTSWSQFSFNFVAPDTGVQFKLSGGTATSIYLDDISVQQINLPASSSVTQLLTDGNMEASGVSAWTAGNAATLTKQAGSAHGGTQVLRVARSTVDNPYTYQTVMITGQTYRVSGYMRSDGNTSPKVANANGVNIITGTVSTTWQPFDAVFVANGTTGPILQSTNATGTQYSEFDDVTVSLDNAIRPGELTQDGGLETWIDATHLTNWTNFAVTSTVNKESSVIHGGSFAARIDIDSSNNSAGIGENYIMIPGKTYVVSYWAKSNIAGKQIVITDYQEFVAYSTQALTTSYVNYSFTVVATYTGIKFRRGTSASSSLYLDDISVTEVSPLVGLPTNGVTLGATASGHLTNAYSFNGTNNNVNIYSSDLNSAFNPNEGTIVAWAKVANSGVWTDGTQRDVFAMTADGSNYIVLYKTTSSNSFSAQYQAGGVAKAVGISASSTSWMQIVMTWSKSSDQVKVYLNGSQTGSTLTGLGSFVGNIGSAVATIGAGNTSAAQPWSGLINDVHLYGRALTAAEISDLYGNGTVDRQAYYTENYPGHELIRQFNSAVTTGSAAAEEVGAGPVVYYKLDESTGTTANNSGSAGSTEVGTLNSFSAPATTTSGWQLEDQCVTGKCLRFNGSTNYVSMPYKNLGTTVTYEMWFNASTLDGTARNLFSFMANLIRVSNSQVIWYPNTSITSTSINYALSNNTWNHLAITQTGSTYSLYINGKLVSSGTTASSVTVSTSNDSSQIGAYLGTANLAATYDEVKVFGYARTAAQIQVDYNLGTSSQAGKSSNNFLNNGLAGYWKMDETSGNPVDSSGNGITLTNNNTTTFTGGKFGNAASFNGSNQYFNAGSTIANVNTVSFWVNPVSTTDNFMNLNSTVYVKSSGGTVSLNGATGTIYVNSTASTTVAANTWSLVTVTIPAGISASQIEVGRANSTYAGNGTRIDEVRVYNRALSPNEIAQLYNWSPGPIGYWKFNENTGTVANDSSGYGNTGTWYGTLVNQWTIGKYGSAGIFNGTDNYVKTATNVTTAINNLTVEAWINPSVLPQSALPFYVGDSATNGYGFYISASGGGSGNVIRIINGGISGDITSSTATLTANKWTHIALTVTSGNLWSLYVNGILNSTGTGTARTPSLTTAIGASANPATFFNGKIDDVKIYNYVRTPAQILDDMRGDGSSVPTLSTVGGGTAVGQPATPLGDWKFSEGYGTTANNAGNGGSALNATLTNMSSPATSTSGWQAAASGVCKYNGCLAFNGTNNYVNIPDNTNVQFGTGDFSVSTWVKPNVVFYGPSNDGELVSKGSTGFEYAIYQGQIAAYVAGVGINGHAYFTPSNWYHLVMVRSSGIVSFYVNGKLDVSASAPGDVSAVGTPIQFGNRPGASNGYLNGLMDDTKLYNFALTQDQINLDYNAGGALTGGGVGGVNEAANDLTDGAGNPPLAYLNFNENTGSTVNDRSGQGNTGTWAGTLGNQWSIGKIGSAGNFNGIDNKVTLTNLTTSQTYFTVEAWVKPQVWGSSSDNQYIVDKDIFCAITYNDFPFSLFVDGTGTTYTTRIGNGTDFVGHIESKGGYAPNTWHHVVSRYDGSIFQLYVDGALASSDSWSGNSTLTALPYTIGAPAQSYGGCGSHLGYFKGQIDDVKIYNYARTVQQIVYDYNRGAPVGWWKFDENQGTTANDSSGNGNTGTITAPTWTAGKINTALSFDHSTTYVGNIPNANFNFERTNQFSGCAWIYQNNTTDLSHEIFSKLTSSGGSLPGWEFASSQNGIPIFYLISNWSGTNYINVQTAAILLPNVWQHVCFTYDGSSNANGVKIYLNGVSQPTIIAGNSLSASILTAANFQIGKRDADLTQLFNGKIDDARIYNYALSAAQVLKIMNDGGAMFYGPTSGTP